MPSKSRPGLEPINGRKWYRDLIHRIYKGLWNSLDLFFPPACGGCGQTGSRWCLSCQGNALEIKPPLCERCGEPMESSGLCHRCKSGKNLPITIRSCFYYEGPIQQAIHQLKYRRNMSLGSALADSMSGYLEETGWVFDTVLPVPLGVARMNERGYNQAALLAQPIALRFGVEYRPRGLVKIRDTPSQVGLTFDQRQDNVEGAFKAIPAQVAGRSILVIDDVTTSNATLRACAEALVTARANQIYCLTLARPSKR